MSTRKRPLIGIGVLIIRNGKILLGQRKKKSSIGYKSFELPGGHLEYGESFFRCAQRELGEETGLELLSMDFLCSINFVIDGKHYVDIDFIGQALGEPRVLEKNKELSWKWYDLNDRPYPLFPPAMLALNSYSQRGNLCHDL